MADEVSEVLLELRVVQDDVVLIEDRLRGEEPPAAAAGARGGGGYAYCKRVRKIRVTAWRGGSR